MENEFINLLKEKGLVAEYNELRKRIMSFLEKLDSDDPDVNYSIISFVDN